MEAAAVGNIHLDYLRAFVALSETLSFTQAARQLGITQPSISRQIRILEDELETQLFFRDKHRVQLTPEGLRLKTELMSFFSSFG